MAKRPPPCYPSSPSVPLRLDAVRSGSDAIPPFATIPPFRSPPLPPAPAPYRLLGGFRLLLAVLVFLQHALANLAPSWLEAALGPLEVGSIAVLVFFALSGFIVTEAARSFYADRPAAFLANRMLRIYPSYLAALALTYGATAMALALGGADGVRAHLGFLPSRSAAEVLANAGAALPGGRAILDALSARPVIEVAWALRIELAFYVCLFLALAAARHLGEWRRAALAATLVALVAGWWVKLPGFGSGVAAFVPYFVFGVALQFAVSDRSGTSRRVGAAVLSLAAAALCMADIPVRPPLADGLPFTRNGLAQAVLFAVLVALWGVLLAVPERALPPRAVALDKLAGEATYPLYLLHTAAAVLIGALVPGRGFLPFGLALVTSVGLAWAATVTYERWIGVARSKVRGLRL